MKSNNYNLVETTDKVKRIYYLYLAGIFTLYITSFMGYMMAWGEKKKNNNSVLLDLHYSYQFKIMNINCILNALIFFGSLAYVCYLFTTIDFMNLEIEKEVVRFLDIIYICIGLNLATTLLFYYQVINGLHKINNNEMV